MSLIKDSFLCLQTHFNNFFNKKRKYSIDIKLIDCCDNWDKGFVRSNVNFCWYVEHTSSSINCNRRKSEYVERVGSWINGNSLLPLNDKRRPTTHVQHDCSIELIKVPPFPVLCLSSLTWIFKGTYLHDATTYWHYFDE